MIKCYFGVPGVGKSTILVREYKKLRKKYDHVYTLNLQIKGVEMITKEDLEKYKFKNTLILWDEITMDADNREFKTFSKDLRDFFLLHRHFGCDVVYATQNFENVDKKVKDLTCELWYMSKSVVPLLGVFTTAKRIYRKININEHTSELTLGYRFCNFLESIFVSNFKLIFRPLYYKYFDTHDELSLKERVLYEERNKPKEEDNIEYIDILPSNIIQN